MVKKLLIKEKNVDKREEKRDTLAAASKKKKTNVFLLLGTKNHELIFLFTKSKKIEGNKRIVK